MIVNVMGSTLHKIVGDRVQPIAVRSLQEWFETPTAIVPAPNGGVWAGTFFGRLPRIVDDREVESIGSSNGTRALFVDRAGNLWRGTRMAGIEVFSGTNIHSLHADERAFLHQRLLLRARSRGGLSGPEPSKASIASRTDG